MRRRLRLCACLLATALPMAAANADRSDLSPKDRARVAAVTRPTSDFGKAEPFEAMQGGATTSRATPNGDAFSHPSANLSFAERERFFLGNGFFKKLWSSAPSSTQASDGLGPLFNARSCQGCHLKDGRGRPPTGLEDDAVSMFLRLSVPPKTDAVRDAIADGSLLVAPEPTYGGQLQNFATPGVRGEGRMRIAYEEVPVMLSGGETASPRRPAYSIEDLAYGPLNPETMLSPRVAPPMIGLGLLEAIHPDDILALADPDDRDGDGISGRTSWRRNTKNGERALGRFGWKASTVSVRDQSAGAFAGDMGISTPDMPNHWGDCTDRQTACRDQPTGVQANLGEVEAPDPIMDLVEFYARNLAVPVRRDVAAPDVLRGKHAFYEAGCTACHQAKFVTRRDAREPEHRFQLIWPYTDMLLHDMGDGLADNRPAGSADGREWRTAPLWGVGLTETVNGHTFFLHDGRARSLLEAILWHGGEAEAARQTVVDMPPEDRAALIRFLESL